MKQLVPNTKTANNIILVIKILMILEIISLFLSFLQYNITSRYYDNKILTDNLYNIFDAIISLVGILFALIYLFSVYEFIKWFRTAYSNLHILFDLRIISNNLKHQDHWAAYSWFIPLLNLFRPYEIMKELYSESITVLNTQNISIKNEIKTHQIGWWWFFFIVTGILSKVINKFPLEGFYN